MDSFLCLVLDQNRFLMSIPTVEPLQSMPLAYCVTGEVTSYVLGNKTRGRRELEKEINIALFVILPLKLVSTSFFCLSVSPPPLLTFSTLPCPDPKSSHLDYP